MVCDVMAVKVLSQIHHHICLVLAPFSLMADHPQQCHSPRAVMPLSVMSTMVTRVTSI